MAFFQKTLAKDLYETLGISKESSADEIKRAYRKLAAKYHPDVNKEEGTTEKFKEIQEAYEVLSDPQKKSQYDQFGSVGGGGFGGGGFGGFDYEDFAQGFGGAGAGGLGDIFETFFGGGGGGRKRGPSKGRNIHADVRITLEEAVNGKQYVAEAETLSICSKCTGTGHKKGTGYKTCSTCSGTGQVTRQQRTPLGIIQTATVCSDCHGEGRFPEYPCEECNGQGRVPEKKKIIVDIPPGVYDEALLRVSGKGEAGERGQPAGDFLLRVHILPHKKFHREGNDIHSKLKISILEAILGNEREIETVQGKTTIRIPAGTQPEAVLKIRGKGMPVLQRNAFGDHLLHVEVEIPKKLSKKEKELYSQLAQESGQKIHPEEKGLFDGLFG